MSSKIVYANHAEFEKFDVLKRHNFKVSKGLIEDTINNPEHEDKESNNSIIIASKSIDEKHILRVVYRKENDIITIITFYPAEKGRYY